MARYVFVPVTQRNRRVGAFQPERVLFLRKRDTKHHVVHLADTGIIGKEPFTFRVYEGVEGGDTYRIQHRLHIVGEALAVAEARLLHLAGRIWLVTSDT